MLRTKDRVPFRNRSNYKRESDDVDFGPSVTDQSKNLPMRKVMTRFRRTGDLMGMIMRKPVYDYKSVEDAVLDMGRVPPHRRRNFDLSDYDTAIDRAHGAIKKAKEEAVKRSKVEDDRISELESVADQLEREAEDKAETHKRALKARNVASEARKKHEEAKATAKKGRARG